MISWFLSKNKTRTTTCDELVDVLVQNNDLIYKEGITNIGGINLYHYKTDGDAVQFSYGSVYLTVETISSNMGRASVWMGTIGGANELLECMIKDESVVFSNKKGAYEEIPLNAFDSEIDFFQYTLLNLKYECSDASLIKLLKFITEILNEQSK